MYDAAGGGERNAVGMVERVRLEKYDGLWRAVDRRAACGREGILTSSECSLECASRRCGSSWNASASADSAEEGVEGADRVGVLGWLAEGVCGRESTGELGVEFGLPSERLEENQRRTGRVGLLACFFLSRAEDSAGGDAMPRLSMLREWEWRKELDCFGGWWTEAEDGCVRGSLMSDEDGCGAVA